MSAILVAAAHWMQGYFQEGWPDITFYAMGSVGGFFILSGFSKIGASEATQGYIASVGLPVPMLAYLAAIVVELGGGILLVVGYRARVRSPARPSARA